jgi:RimJ/RimL family protein N-acetyltransferase
MIKLRTLNAADVATIQNWPPYPPEFEDLDYALRSNGWLAEYRDRPDTWIYIAEQAGEIIAFTTLARTGDTEAEFRIALRADTLGQGLGETITVMTLAKGFSELKLACIHLIARKNNPRAIRLYQRLGFTEHGECMMNINGKQVDFLHMEIAWASYAEHSW